MSSPALSARGLTKSFARGLARSPTTHVALRDVNLDVCRGEIVALVGCAGAGKTTLLQCLCGLLRCDSGTVRLFGEALERSGCSPAIAYLPAIPLFYPFLTPRDILEVRAARSGNGTARSEGVDRVLSTLGLDRVERCRISALSRETVRRVAIAEALVARPEVILADTDANALTPAFDDVTLEAIGSCAAAGAAVILASRDAAVVTSVATRILVLAEGRSTRTFVVESFGEPIVVVAGPRPARLLAERVH